MNFGQPATTSSFSFGTPTTATPQAPAAGGFSFGSLGGSDGKPMTATGFGGTPSATPAPAFSLTPNASTASLPGGAAKLPTSGFSFGGTPAPTSAPSTLSFGSVPQTVAPVSNILPTATSTGTELSFNAQKSGLSTTTATSVPSNTAGFTITNPTTTSAPTLGSFTFTSGNILNTTNTITTTSTTSTSIPTSLTTGTTTTQSTSVPATQLNFCELEELINKWTLVLEEQEKVYTNQATQVNAWDKVLISNGDKIIALNEAVDKVKAEQQTLEQELEFISAQHSELEECITPLQTELSKIPQVDVERAQIYLLAENLDTQLKQMSEDLKEVVEHLNEANKAQDPNDPIVQIGRILNAHMMSLQWIETSSTQITNKLDDITKIHDNLKRDNERSLRFVYYDQ